MIILEDTRNQVGKHDKSSESTMDFEPSRKKNCENVYTIYMHICPNGKRYVGYTSTTISQRSGATGKRYKPNKRFYEDIIKFGWDNIEHIVLKTCETLDEAMEVEKYYISKFNTTNENNGYNKSVGGYPGDMGYSEEERKKRRNESSKKWAQKNPDKIKEYRRKHDKKPRRKARANELNKTPERRSHRTEYMRKYRNLNREKIREINRRCRERRKNNDNTSGYEAKEEPS